MANQVQVSWAQLQIPDPFPVNGFPPSCPYTGEVPTYICFADGDGGDDMDGGDAPSGGDDTGGAGDTCPVGGGDGGDPKPPKQTGVISVIGSLCQPPGAPPGCYPLYNQG